MLKTRRFLAIANGCGGSHAGRTCRLGRADDSFRHTASGRLPGHQRGLFLLVGARVQILPGCRGGYYGGGCYTVKKYCKKRGYYY